MKKIILMLALLISAVMSNAQTAIQTSNALDNISIGITDGVSTPLDFNSMFPLNTNVGLKVQKDFTTAFGVQLEGLAILNDNHFSDLKTSVKATNIGINGVFNLSNIFGGYKGVPRTFEISTVVGEVKEEVVEPEVKKFKNSPFISPVYGIEKTEAVNDLELENTANYEKLDAEIKKTNEFLMTLKELQSKLD